jgi:hypothetical protein
MLDVMHVERRPLRPPNLQVSPILAGHPVGARNASVGTGPTRGGSAVPHGGGTASPRGGLAALNASRRENLKPTNSSQRVIKQPPPRVSLAPDPADPK